MFNERLKEARKNAGYSQEKLGQMLNVSKQTISDYEKGKTEPDMSKVALIIKILSIDANYLWQDEMKATSEPMFSPEAQALARIYDELDPHSKRIVYTVATMESERKPEPALPKGIMPISALPFHNIPNIGTLNCTGELETRYAARQELAELESSPDITPVE